MRPGSANLYKRCIICDLTFCGQNCSGKMEMWKYAMPHYLRVADPSEDDPEPNLEEKTNPTPKNEPGSKWLKKRKYISS